MSTATGSLQWSTDNCSVARTLGVVGDRWSFQVLREVFLGVRRFEDVRARTGAPRQVLSDRLARLVDEGLLRREPYREPGQRERQEYRLTAAGLELYPALVALMAWGDRHRADPEGPSLRLEHRGCGAPVTTTLACAEGHLVGSPRDVRALPGPGARRRAG